MARISRVIAPGYPHHITQRGNRGQEVFFCDDDYLVNRRALVTTLYDAMNKGIRLTTRDLIQVRERAECVCNVLR